MAINPVTDHSDQRPSAVLERWRQQLAAAAAAAPPDADKFDYPAVVDGKPMLFTGCRIISVEPEGMVPSSEGETVNITMRFDRQVQE